MCPMGEAQVWTGEGGTFRRRYLQGPREVRQTLHEGACGRQQPSVWASRPGVRTQLSLLSVVAMETREFVNSFRAYVKS